MMNQFLRAGGEGEGIFWMIFIIIWIIGKISSANRKTQRKSNASRRPPARPATLKPKLAPDELQAFLDSLTGGRVQPKTVPAAPMHRQIVKRHKPAASETATEIREPAPSAQSAAAVQITRQMSLLNTSVRDLITDIPSARMPNLNIGYFTPQAGTPPIDKPDLRDRAQLRKAMLGHLILSRPPSAGW
ncbi:MAG: hypothetical protein AB7T27_04845 [Kiritimatiellia bacterium]